MLRHVASVAEIVADLEAAIRFYRDVLGLKVEKMPGGGYAKAELPGILHFGIWERAHAARTVFGADAAPERVPLGFTLGLEVDGVDADAKALAGSGLGLIQAPHDEPWGQRTARFLSPSGMLCELAETPWARELGQASGTSSSTEASPGTPILSGKP
jgi:catechol 2,3-dioxygenase-like lactoylglutathione lyase family enzyme